jgi:cystathionine gamma-synthase
MIVVAFRQPNPVDNPTGSLASAVDFRNPTRHVYSRYTQQVSTRAEHILSQVNVSC